MENHTKPNITLGYVVCTSKQHIHNSSLNKTLAQLSQRHTTPQYARKSGDGSLQTKDLLDTWVEQCFILQKSHNHSQHTVATDQLRSDITNHTWHKAEFLSKQTPLHQTHPDPGLIDKKHIHNLYTTEVKENKLNSRLKKNLPFQTLSVPMFLEFSTLPKRGFTRMTSVPIAATADILPTNQYPSTSSKHHTISANQIGQTIQTHR